MKRIVIYYSKTGSNEFLAEHFGYGSVFLKLEKRVPDVPLSCQAFPIALALREEDRENGELIMNTRLTESNFKGELRELFEDFTASMKQPSAISA